ncbi:PaaI family thioesterase [Amycolatopsis speibonae]|uniref:PaaI family thioesterase n=1 Tax=Amycolatopsis speibonae TaxID=1450224 RepID=A0ABV7P0T1_9PSEU
MIRIGIFRLAAITAQATDRDVVAVDQKINFLSGAGPGQVLRATGTVSRAGRTLTVRTAHLHAVTADHDEHLVALALATLMARNSSPAAEEHDRG